MKKSNVLENAFASTLLLADLSNPQPGQENEEAAVQAAEAARLEAEWTEKMNKAFEQGLAQGEKHAAERTAPLMKALRKAREELLGIRDGLEAEAEQQILALAVRMAEAVIQTQVAFDESVLKASLKLALARVAPSSVVKVRVNPKDLAAAEKLAALSAQGIELEADDSVGVGGCVLDTQLGGVFSTIEHRWEAARRMLADSARRENEDA